jgi:hypothetical protein
MSIFVPIALFGWLGVALALFKYLTPHRAAIAGFLLSWMFLPWYTYNFVGIPDYNKTSAIGVGIMLGLWIFDRASLVRLKFHWVDIPMALWCCTPLGSSLSNGLGVYDGLSAILGRLVFWGVPYLIGRVYFSEPAKMRDLMIGIFIAGLIYMPLCVFEIIMSPQLHKMVYGFHANATFGQNKRLGGWRPVVFMQHGIMLGTWMATACISAIRILRLREKKWLPNGYLPWFWLSTLLLIIVTILCKATGALVLLLLGILLLETATLLRNKIPLYILIVVPILYCALRATGTLPAETVIEWTNTISTDTERVGSVAFRLDNEAILVDKAMEQPLLGWGGWRRSFVRDAEGAILSVPDGLWVIAIGENGIFGLVVLGAVFLLPQFFMLGFWKPQKWGSGDAGFVLLASVLLGLFTLDCLMNDMFNPLLVAVAGGLSGMRALQNYDSPGPRQLVAEPKTVRPRLI